MRAEAHWVVTYLAAFGFAALVLIPFAGVFLDRWPVDLAVNAVWMILLVALPVWASRRQATLRGASARIGIAFGMFGLLYGVTGILGITRFADEVWGWVIGGIASAAPLLLAAWARGTTMKRARRRPPRTWLSVTDAGRQALSGHLRALQRIAASGKTLNDAKHR